MWKLVNERRDNNFIQRIYRQKEKEDFKIVLCRAKTSTGREFLKLEMCLTGGKGYKPIHNLPFELCDELIDMIQLLKESLC